MENTVSNHNMLHNLITLCEKTPYQVNPSEQEAYLGFEITKRPDAPESAPHISVCEDIASRSFTITLLQGGTLKQVERLGTLPISEVIEGWRTAISLAWRLSSEIEMSGLNVRLD